MTSSHSRLAAYGAEADVSLSDDVSLSSEALLPASLGGADGSDPIETDDRTLGEAGDWELLEYDESLGNAATTSPSAMLLPPLGGVIVPSMLVKSTHVRVVVVVLGAIATIPIAVAVATSSSSLTLIGTWNAQLSFVSSLALCCAEQYDARILIVDSLLRFIEATQGNPTSKARASTNGYRQLRRAPRHVTAARSDGLKASDHSTLPPPPPSSASAKATHSHTSRPAATIDHSTSNALWLYPVKGRKAAMRAA